MCLSKPAQVIEVDPDRMAGVVDNDGRRQRVSLAVVVSGGVSPAPGDWVLMSSGVPIEVIEKSEAEELIEMWKEIDDHD